MTDVLKRIQGLVARAGSSVEEEARTAAHIACALIREHKIELRMPVGRVRRTRETEAQESRPQPDRTFKICRGCAARIPWEETFCDVCKRAGREDRNPGYWTIECDACGKESPRASNTADALDRAWDAGFRVVGEKTLCPGCRKGGMPR